MSNMTMGRRLTEGVGAWLMYETSCGRDGLFSEKYLSNPIGQVLNGFSKHRVLAEYKHEPLANRMTGAGRRPAVDFVIFEKYPKIKIAIESKWIGKTKPTVESIIWDIIRLEMLAYEYQAECYFIIGGRKRSLDAYFNTKKFSGPNKAKRILNVDSNNMHSFDITPNVRHRIKTMKNIFKATQDIAFPNKIRTQRFIPFPPGASTMQYQIYTWKISSLGRKNAFYPKNSKHYSA